MIMSALRKLAGKFYNKDLASITDEKGRKMYKKMLSREELITVLYRALHRNIVD